MGYWSEASAVKTIVFALRLSYSCSLTFGPSIFYVSKSESVGVYTALTLPPISLNLKPAEKVATNLMPPDVLALKSPSSCSLNVTTVPRPCLPPELLDRIMTLAMESRYGTPTSSLDSFAALTSFTLASTALRHIALRRFFRHIILFSTSGDERAHWDAMFTILASLERNGLQCFEWVRFVTVPL